MQEVITTNKESSQQQKRARLILQLKQNNVSVNPIKRRDSQDSAPLSYAQEPLWIMSQLEPDNPVYNVSGAIEFKGFLNTEALQQNLDEVIRRHEILHSRFIIENSLAVQQTAPDNQLNLIRLDLSSLDAQEQLKVFHDCSDDFTRSPFDLTTDSPLRGMLAVLGQQQHILLLALHHIVSDRWSVGILMQEVAALYTAFSNGQPSSLPELSIHYGDFSVWQRQQVETTEKHLRYWQQKLNNAPPLLELPTDYPRPSVQRYSGNQYSFELPKTLSAPIQLMGKQHNATLFMVMAAALNALFYRYTGSQDIVIGYTSAGRNQAQTENLIGFFVNTLVLRNQFQGDLPFSELLVQIREQALEDQVYQEVSFGQLVEVVNPVRNSRHAPLFQVMLTVQNAPTADFRLPELQVRPIALENRISQFDLTYLIEEKDGGLHGIIEYSTDLFDVATLARMTGHLETLLEGIVSNPDRPINQLPLLTKNELKQLLIDWNKPFTTQASEYESCQLIHQLFEAQAQATPDKTALVFASESISYRELNSRSNQLAHFLQDQGITPESRVGVSAERSVELIIALLAVLKAGAAYVPLDPDYPEERLNYIISDAGIELLLTQSVLLDKFRYCGCYCLNIDESYAHCPTDSPATAATVGNTAYLIYTSGSTGQPKGVLVGHGNLLHSTLARTRYYHDPLDSFLLLSSFAFDSSVAGIFWTLSQGARLCLPQPDDINDPTALAELIHQQQVSHLLALPSFYKVIMSDGNIPLLDSLKTVIVAGEACSGDIAAEHHRKMTSVKFYNEYGPTEATVWSSVYQSIQAETNALVSIGRAIENAQIYILDQQCQPVPIGVSGELCIGGSGVAQGYLNHFELTAEKFIPNPFSPSGQRLYKTGDLARYRTDGNIEFLGRIDHQVKIRGYRIELGEIEAWLAAYHGINAAVVIVREDQPENKRLVAYFTAHDKQAISGADLRSHLLAVLPEYMVPSAFVIMETFPLTANGKLDRRALPAPEKTAVVTQEYEAPEGAVEIVLAQLWQELLGIGQIGRYDNFFELGGHSLLVITLIERLQKQGLSVEVQMVFASPVLAEMAEAISHSDVSAFAVPANRIPADCTAITPEMLPLVSLSQDEIDSIVVNVPKGMSNIQDIYPLAPLQQGILFHHLMETDGDTYMKRSVLSFDSRSRLDSFLEALQCVIDRHDILRSAVFWKGLSQPVQVVHRQALLPIEQLPPALDSDVLSPLLTHTELHQLRMDLQQAPLFAAYVIPDSSSEKWLLALINHHMIDDNYTLQLILAEIQQILQGQAEQLPASLPYRNFIAQALAIAPAEHEAYFKTQLADITEPTAPFGLLNVQGDGRQVTEVSSPLSADLTQRIRRAARQQGVSAAVLFHVAWAQVLGQCTGRHDVVFGTVLLGRLHGSSGAGRVLGMFINTLPVRISLAGLSVSEVVSATYQGLSDLLDHEQASLALAQRCSGVAASLPLFTTLFNYRHSDTIATQDSNLSNIYSWEGIQVLRTEERTNYPITLSVDDTEQGFSITPQCIQGIDPERIAAYLNTAIEGLVDALADNPQRLINTLTILPASECRQLLIDFNGTAVDYPHDRLIHQLFEAQVQQAPAATALVYEAHSLSYRELNQQANRLAHYLLDLGIRPDDRVAICVERSLDMVVGLLGILKAGGAYVPLDPGYPRERLAFMLGDSAPVALLTQSVCQGSLAGLDPTVPVVLLDAGTTSGFSHYPEHNPDPKALGLTSRHLAYVIYTSGSTGQPKGVMNEHRGVVNRLLWAQNEYHLSHDDRVLQKTPFSFDVSVWEFFLPLLAGAQLVMARPEGHQDPHYLAALIKTADITTLHFVPSMLQAFLDNADLDQCNSIRRLLCSGEALSYALQAHVMAQLPAIELHNLYGPTEAAIDVTSWRCQPGMHSGIVPIGSPIANTQIYILDAYLEPVPLGVTGEIYIGGAGVARGYLNRPELTAERFLVNPFSPAEGNLDTGAHHAAHPGGLDISDRLYKTGDLGRWRPDGSIEFLGRNDFQVKIRGFRIELGEIEAQLAKCPGVREAVVIAREDSPGDKRLVAYLLAQDHTELSAATLRSQLATVLADYQLPSAYVTLDAFPLTPNGKLDRKALPASDGGAVVSRLYAAPQGPIETALARIWQELLHLDQVGRYDHFFELGGHSLMIVTLIERLRQQGLSASVRTVFTTPILTEMAAVLDASDSHSPAFVVPANLITADCAAITPDLLPLVSLTQQEIDHIVDNVPHGAANIQDIYPLAPLQEGILFHHLLETQGDAYLLRSVISFDSRNRLDSFLEALQRVINRHDILRTAICWEGLPQPVQVVYRQAPLPVEELLLGTEKGGQPADTIAGVATSRNDTALQQLLARTDPRHLRLDLQRAPLFKAIIAADLSGSDGPQGNGQWLLALLNHHLVCDHLTLELIIAEIQQILQGQAEQLPASLPYRNFIAQALAASPAEHEAYFRTQLGDIDEPTAPFGLLNVQGDGGQVTEARLPLSTDLAQRIRRAARQQGVSAAVLFHVAWAQVLGQCAGRDDVVFGTVLLGRLHGSAGADRVLGMFINTLPVRISLAGLSVSEVVSATYQRLSDLLDHEQASLALAQRCSGVAASLPLFTTLFNYRHSPGDTTEHDLTTASTAGENNTNIQSAWDGIRQISGEERTNYPIDISIDDLGQGFSINAQAVPGVDPERIAAYLNTAIEGLVDALADNPQRLINTLTILPASERRQLLIDFNGTAVDYPHDRLIHQLFEAQVQQAPDATALVYETHSLSYRELNQQANRLAHYLLDLGIRPDDRVAICVERSLDMVVGLLGILKAGGAYVPLDPGYPSERLAFMLGDSAPVALLTQSVCQGRLAGLDPTVPVVLLDAGTASGFSHYPAHNPDPKALGLTSRHLAYVIYTSGSTGQPKGVMVEHGHVVNLIQTHISLCELTSADRTLQFASISFDTSVAEIFPTLSVGAALVLRPNELRIPDDQFITFLQTHRITYTDLPTAFWHHWAQEIQSSHFQPVDILRLVVVGGEKAELRHLVSWMAQLSLHEVRLINNYGPTEATVYATAVAFNSQSSLPANEIPIGSPIANTQIYILDAHLQPVPLGVTGEIYIGGAGVARGYLNRPELTAERFLVNPFSPAEGNLDTGAHHAAHPGGLDISDRLYKTGDLGRWRPDGNIEYLGRNDFQVKIRGFRIELGEIEAQLAKCPGVREAVVIAREDSSGDKRLVAYLLAQDHTELSAATLRSQLATVLADYQLPSAYVTLDAFPLTPNGKLDRKALPAPDGGAVVSRLYAAPQGPIETALARIWQELLHLDQVGRYDHFFELGGHSLMIVTLIERLRQQGLSASVRTVFTTPILTEMAAVLDASDSHSPAFVVPANLITADCAAITPDLLPLVSLTQQEIDHIVDNVPHGAANIQDIYPLAPLQEGILFHHLLETQGDAYLLRSVISFDSRNRLDSFLEALQRVINRHDILRTAICWEGLPQPVQVVYRQAPLPVEELLLGTEKGGQPADTIAGVATSRNDTALQQLFARTDPRHLRLDLQRAPLFKAIIAADLSGSDGPQGNGQWLLALLNHHLVCDHLTLELIIAEIQQILQGQAEQLPASLPYRNFIAQALAASPAEHEAYFRTQLGDIDEPTAPFGLLNVQGDGGQVTEARLPLSTDLAQRIRRAARQQGVSAAVLFHVAWAQVLGQCAGRDDVVFGTVLLGRLHGSAGADRVLGMFINTLPVRISLAGLSVSEVVSATYQRLSDLLDHEQASLALAQRCSGVAASLPLFTTLFNYRHSPGDTTEHDLTTASTAGENNTNIQSAWDGIRQISGEERTNYPIDISIDDLGQGFSINAQAVPGVDPERIAAYLNTAIEGLVDALADNPQRLINTLTILPASERRQLLIDFNGTAVDYPHDRLIHQLFEAQVQQAPDATALVYEAHSLSYRELNQQANRLAHYLLDLGIRPDDRVAICVERSLDMVVGLLGILKAGGAYVPLDPGYPSERLAFMLGDSAPVALLTQSVCQGSLAGLDPTVPVVLLDAGTASGFSHYPAHNPDPKALGLTSRHLAYVIYTSGSTGQPKGVMVEHKGLCNLISAQQRTFKITSSSHLLQFASCSFDACIWEITLSICSGASLHLASREALLPGESLVMILQDHEITHAILPPSALAIIPKNMQLEHLQTLIVGGDVCSPVLAHHWSKQYHFFNAYGPTETTVCATTYYYKPSETHTLPIGHPIANTQIYILDAHLQPVPLGVTGEIYIGGAGVARGYLNRPELTAERFLVNPFSPAEGNLDIGAHHAAHPGGQYISDRLYKTGDLGRWLPNGNIEYLGRNDFQVKIRGFRIELGEIEAQLAKCPGVREAVVIARGDSSGDKRLVAYLLAQDQTELSASALRSQLATVLADYQLPSAYVTLDAFPLTPNGKLDRKALPAPDGGAVVSRPYEVPQGPIETTVARIWQELLGLEQVGRYDNFFELGGHSLMAVQLQARIRVAFDIEISLKTLFERPALENLSDYIVSLQLNFYSENDMEDLESQLNALSEEELRNYLKECNNEQC